MINKIKENYKYLLLSFILIIISLLTFFTRIKELKKIDSFNNNEYIVYIILIIIGIIIAIFVNRAFKKNMKLEKIFLFFVIPLGILYMVLLPVGRVIDEKNHFFRAYEISQGKLLSTVLEDKRAGDYFSNNFDGMFSIEYKYDDYLDDFSKKVDDTSKFYDFNNTSQYSFVSYVPQAIGIKIADTFHLPILVMAIFGRLFNFLAFITLMYFAIKLMPFKKYSILFVMFFPMMMQEAISLSVDPIINSVSFLFIAYILNIRYNRKDTLKTKDKIILSILAIVMSVCKIIYMPLCLLIFLIPENKFKNKKRKYIEIGVLALFVILINFVWLKLATRGVVNLEENVDASKQLSFVLAHPLDFIQAIFSTISFDFYSHIEKMIIGPLGWMDINVNTLSSVTLIALLVMVGILDNTKLKKGDKCPFVIVSFLTIFLLYLAEYLTWTKVGNISVAGIQGRYFIPLLIPFFIIFNFSKIKYEIKSIYKYIFLIIIFINIYCLINVFICHI